MRTRATAVLAVTAMVALAGCGDLASIGDELDDQHQFRFSGERLEIENRDADLRIVPGADGTVEVERSLTGKATQDGNATVELADGALTLSVTCSGIVVDCGGFHIVHVPPGVAVEVTSRGGAVRSAGFPGDLAVTVDDSWLRVEEPAGALDLTASLSVVVVGAESPEVTAESIEDRVELQFSTAPNQVKAVAGQAAEITLPDGDETYRINASSSTGEVDSTVPTDPESERVIEAVAEHGSVSIQAGDDHA